MILMKTASGRQAHINNSRRASYGYDQRLEVHGAKGRLMAGNRTPTTVELANATNVSADKPMYFFLERYAEAYRAELDAFVAAALGEAPASPSGEDGLRAQILADAATEAARSGRPVRVG
jgi:myo-inositol 2-dehydrogenase/D-chiro-inositol 1-dehydrogenase